MYLQYKEFYFKVAKLMNKKRVLVPVTYANFVKTWIVGQ